ncbi:MAG TPA: PQQ-binding-like beta-propeller repeat protein, partial [Planctomycetota bacterium]|nr:PQQ-binding-like beta-propeller repeat protein [Planctomycetota bacterium]
SRGPLEGATAKNVFNSGSTVQAIDSSPTVVGNRVYFGTSIQGLSSKSGTITCLDSETGALVWQYTGADLTPVLQPVFSSPAVTVENGEAKYLLSGEGYHVERDSRIICLDLGEARKTGTTPRAKWIVQTTSHVESSPCVFEGKVYIGAGDDGWWCVDVETGKVIWRVEGCTHYIVQEGPHVEALTKLAGRTVAVGGVPHRHHLEDGKETSLMFLDVTEVTEVPPGTTVVPTPAQSANGKVLRTVIGKVVVADSPQSSAQKGSRIKIEMEKVYADAECPPVALRVNGQPRLYCGAGIDGQSVICLDAETGKEIWRTKTSDPVFSAPTVVDGRVYVGLSNGTYVASAANPAGSVLALNANDGSILWECKTADGVLGAVAVTDGKAYACSRDGCVYVLDANATDPKGKLIKKYQTGGAMTCSPAVTDKGIFVANARGKVYCIKRDTLEYGWSVGVTPGQAILSSPCVVNDRLFVGSAVKGLFCLVESGGAAAARKAIQAWNGVGGNAARTAVADEIGPPAVNGNRADRISDPEKIKTKANTWPVAASAGKIFFSASAGAKASKIACVDAKERKQTWETEVCGLAQSAVADDTHAFVWTRDGEITTLFALSSSDGSIGWKLTTECGPGPYLSIAGKTLIYNHTPGVLVGLNRETQKEAWRSANLGPLAGPPALAHGLIFASTSEPAQLHCLDDATGTKLWSVELPAKPLHGPSVAGDKVFVPLPGKTEGAGRVAGRKLTDGSGVFECDVDKTPATHLAVSGDHLAFAAADGTVLVINTAKVEQTHTVLVGKGGQAPAIWQDVLFVNGENRVGAYNLTESSW